MNQLETLANQYFELRSKMDVIQNKIENIKSQKPICENLISFEEAQNHVQAYQNFKTDLDKAKDELFTLEKNLHSLKSSIIKEIPVSNKWIALELNNKKYAIGKYWDSWGGGETKFIIKQYSHSNELFDLKDHTYYP